MKPIPNNIFPVSVSKNGVFIFLGKCKLKKRQNT